MCTICTRRIPLSHPIILQMIIRLFYSTLIIICLHNQRSSTANTRVHCFRLTPKRRLFRARIRPKVTLERLWLWSVTTAINSRICRRHEFIFAKAMAFGPKIPKRRFARVSQSFDLRKKWEKIHKKIVANCPQPSINLNWSSQPSVSSPQLAGPQPIGTQIMHICQTKYSFNGTISPVNIYKCMSNREWSSNLNGGAVCTSFN